VPFSFPFAPALWNPVGSVSVSDVEPQQRAFYSNGGEVIMDGNWMVGSAAVQGTSFAAPRLAVRHAFHLLTGGEPVCQGHVPVLGYTNSELPGQSWNNLPVASAAAAHCRDFAP
jgi:hypothetical protein